MGLMRTPSYSLTMAASMSAVCFGNAFSPSSVTISMLPILAASSLTCCSMNTKNGKAMSGIDSAIVSFSSAGAASSSAAGAAGCGAGCAQAVITITRIAVKLISLRIRLCFMIYSSLK
ncbi:MAG: hypothetical protein MAG451_01561 [Anaerolineales bacterium]|nr:hypothetical protein [Anaerolineales bacterium]